MPKLFVEFDAQESNGCNNSPGKRGQRYSGYRHIVIHLDVHGLLKEEGELFAESLEVSDEVYNAETGFLVVVRYSTGGTFGSTDGDYQFIGVFSNAKDAKALKNEIDAAYKTYRDADENGVYDFTPNTKNPNYEKIYCSWHGYFDRLEEVRIYPLMIV